MSVGVRRSCWLLFRRLTPRTIRARRATFFVGTWRNVGIQEQEIAFRRAARSHFGKVLKRELRDRDFHRVFDAPSGKSSA